MGIFSIISERRKYIKSTSEKKANPEILQNTPSGGRYSKNVILSEKVKFFLYTSKGTLPALPGIQNFQADKNFVKLHPHW